MYKYKVPKKCLSDLSSKFEELSNFYSNWKSDTDDIEINLLITEQPEEIDEAISDWLNKNESVHENYKRALRRYKSFKKMIEESDVRKIKRVIDANPVIFGWIKKNLPNQILYKETEGGEVLPYRVIKVEYDPGTNEVPASTNVALVHSLFGRIEKRNMSIEMSDLAGGGKTVPEILDHFGYLPENEILNSYQAENLEKFNNMIGQVGEVYVGKGSGELSSSYRSSYYRPNFYFKEEVDNRVVVDFKGYFEVETGSKFGEVKNFSNSEFSNIDSGAVSVPVHPIGHVFHLEEHVWISVHVSNLDRYVFKGEEIYDKLVLHKEDKELVKILIEMSKMKISDIIEGKTGGSFIMATGIPGTGKTLTAEVFSETVKKPLYKVQCSQLGIDVDKIENKLKDVMNRASRWGAILLIDESDIYVRARGNDINQNAIVGVFLRTLEYYRGILFMTSNLETEIDDAIMSRATAHLVYKKPGIGLSLKIWEVILNQMAPGELNHYQIKKLNQDFKGVVGRDIKALVKLAKMYSQGKGKKLTPESFYEIQGFVPNVSKNIELN